MQTSCAIFVPVAATFLISFISPGSDQEGDEVGLFTLNLSEITGLLPVLSLTHIAFSATSFEGRNLFLHHMVPC